MTGGTLTGPVTQVSHARLHASGADPVRVLLVADREQVLEAHGTRSLAQRAADRVWLTTRRGVDLDVLSDLTPVLGRVAAAFDDWRLWRFDAVVLLLDAAASDRRRQQVLQQVHDVLQGDSQRRTPLVLLSTGPARRRGWPEEERRLRERLERTGAGRLRMAEVPPLPGADERSRTWATAIGEQVAALLADRPAPPVHGPEDEAQRQRALDELALRGRAPETRLDDLVRLACSAFDAETAEINFIDRDRQWKMAVAGAEPGGNPRAHSFCNQTITRAEPLVVGDATLDPVLRTSPLASGPHPIRFYAAHPIESLQGYRIGSFCVYDSEPRDVRGLDLAVLRDLALLAQAELIAEDAAPWGAADRLRAQR